MVYVMHMLFMFFAVFKNLKSLFSEDNMSVNALNVSLKMPSKWFELSY